MITPSFEYAVLNSPTDLKSLDILLYRNQYPDDFLEKKLGGVVLALQNHYQVGNALKNYLEKVRLDDPIIGDIIATNLLGIGRDLFKTLVTNGFYHGSKMPYKYHGRQEYDTIVLKFDDAYRVPPPEEEPLNW